MCSALAVINIHSWCNLLLCQQIPVMIYPELGLADQYWIPWWIILIAILAGILLLTLLVCILWKVIYTLLSHSS